MLNQILTNTPPWVWVLLLALLWLGWSQTRARSASLRRITLMPLAMTGLSLYGTLTAFGAEPLVMLTWLGAGGVMATLVVQQALPQATHYDSETRRFALPGSWVPLMLILGIFMTKYVVGAVTAMQPALTRDVSFSLGFGALNGVFSGVFLARAARLWRLALQSDRPPFIWLGSGPTNQPDPW